MGTNQLIKQGAKLIDSVEDILEELNPRLKWLMKAQTLADSVERLPAGPPHGEAVGKAGIADREESLYAKRYPLSAQEAVSNELSDEERLVYNLLGDKPRYVDELIEELNLPSAKIMAMLSKLEIQGIIKQLPGKLFSKA